MTNSLSDNIRNLLNDLERIRDVVKGMTAETWEERRAWLANALDTMLAEPTPEETAAAKADLRRLMKKR